MDHDYSCTAKITVVCRAISTVRRFTPDWHQKRNKSYRVRVSLILIVEFVRKGTIFFYFDDYFMI